MPIVEMVESLVNPTEIQCITPYQFKQALYIIMIVKTVTAILIMDMAIFVFTLLLSWPFKFKATRTNL